MDTGVRIYLKRSAADIATICSVYYSVVGIDVPACPYCSIVIPASFVRRLSVREGGWCATTAAAVFPP